MNIALTCSIKPDGLSDKDKYAEFDSKETINDLAKAIEANGHSVTIINVDENIFETLRKNKNKIDIVFNVAEGLAGEFRESIVQVCCEILGIPYHGPSPLTAAITLNKAKTKEILIANNIPTPKFQVFYNIDEELNKNIHFPLLIKPVLEGSSKGIFNENLVSNEAELKKIVSKIIKNYNQPVIVEEFLNGREFTVSVIGYENPIVLPIVEVKFDHLPKDIHPMDSYESKWIYDNPDFIEKNPDKDPLKCPAEITKELEEKIKKTAIKTFKVLDCKDWSRIDIRLDKNNVPNVLEVNALPGFMKDPKENSRLPKAAYAAGWSYEKLIGEVLNSAIRRLKTRKLKIFLSLVKL